MVMTITGVTLHIPRSVSGYDHDWGTGKGAGAHKKSQQFINRGQQFKT